MPQSGRLSIFSMVAYIRPSTFSLPQQRDSLIFSRYIFSFAVSLISKGKTMSHRALKSGELGDLLFKYNTYE